MLSIKSQRMTPIWFDRYGRSFNEYRLPTKDSERDELAITIGRDGMALLDAIYNSPHTPSHLRDLKAIEILRHTWVQQYWMDDGQVCWRAGKQLPPCGIRLQSPYETDARYSTKRSVSWVAYPQKTSSMCLIANKISRFRVLGKVRKIWSQVKKNLKKTYDFCNFIDWKFIYA